MKKLFLIFLGIFLLFFGIEFYLRLFNPQFVYRLLPQSGSKCFEANKIYFAAPKSNTTCRFITPEYDVSVKINNQGFIAENNTKLEKTAGIKRIVFIGDSFTFGQGVKQSQSYPYLIGEILNKKGFENETINASTVGAGTAWYYLRLKEKVLEFKPDLVIIGLYLGNDLSDLDQFKLEQLDNLGLPAKITLDNEYIDKDGSRRSTAIPLRYRLSFFRNLHTFIFLSEKIFGSYNLSGNNPIDGHPCMLQPDCLGIDKHIDKTVGLLEGMDNLAQKNNVKFLVAIIPWELQFPRNVLDKSKINFFAKYENRHNLSVKIGSRLKDRQIPYFDLLPFFENYKGTSPVLYLQDRHWTKTGHEIAAEAIAPAILEIFRDEQSQVLEKE